MIKKINKNDIRKARHARIRYNLKGTAKRPRLNVYRSTSHIYAQLIDDTTGHTIASSSSMSKDVNAKGLAKKDVAKAVGIDVAKKAIVAGINEAIFDRGGYLYAGRVAALAEGAREAGLKF